VKNFNKNEKIDGKCEMICCEFFFLGENAAKSTEPKLRKKMSKMGMQNSQIADTIK